MTTSYLRFIISITERLVGRGLSKNADHEKYEELHKERGHLIVKRNDLIQKSRHQMELQEQMVDFYGKTDIIETGHALT